MIKKIAIIAAAMLLMATITNAAVWRVNNRNNVNADFTTLQDAIDGATADDTIYIEASAVSYGNGIFDKKLTVIGAGYWQEENDTTQAFKEYSRVGQLVFNSGSQGSVVQGLYMYYAQANQGTFHVVSINTDSIIIERNNINVYKSGQLTEGNANAIFIAENTSDIKIKNNWLSAHIYDNNASNNGNAIGIFVEGIPENTIIMSNFLRSYKTNTPGNLYSIYLATNNQNNELILTGNVMWGDIKTYYTFHYDNILVSGSYNNGTGDQSFNNLCDATQYPDINDNQQNVDMSTVFVDHEKYIDNGYLLAPGSPAIGAAINGGDCGVFGDYPYILSGMPEIPAIFEAKVIPVGTENLPVNIKATSHN